MLAQKGRDILIKMSDGATPPSFTTMGGLRTQSLSLNAESVDISHSGSEGWRELLAGAGLRQASVSGNGIFLDGEAADAVRDVFFAGDIREWRLVFPGMGVVSGLFQISTLDYAGDYKGEVTFSLTLESAGALTLTPLAEGA